MNASETPAASATGAGFCVCTTMFSAPMSAIVSATKASMYSACGRRTPITASARVRLWPMVKPVTTNTRSRRRREINTSPKRKDM